MDGPPQQRRERLEVPLVSPLERRLNVLGGQPSGAAKPQTAPVPRSAVLDRLQRFMPELQAANATLEQELRNRPAQEFDIEAVDEEADGGYIEMDLACGVVDLLDENAVAAAEDAVQGRGGLNIPVGAASDDDDDSSDEDSSDDDSRDSDVDDVEAGPSGAQQCAPGSSGAGTSAEPMDTCDGGTAPAGAASSSPAAGRHKVKAKRNPKIQEMK